MYRSRRFFLVALSALALTRDAGAHSRLLASVPAAGASIPSGEGEFVLRFDESAVLTSLRLFGPSGAEVALTRTRDATPKAEWRARHPRLTLGAHRLEWRALSADGHAIGGAIAFTVAGP